MSELKHTPGPYLRDGLTIYTLEPGRFRGKTIERNRWAAHVYREGTEASDAELLAVARLFAAAPELLEALEETLNWLTSYPGGGALGCYDKARAAIAKATGGAL